MDSGAELWDTVFQRLVEAGDVRYRLALVQLYPRSSNDKWAVHTLVVEHAPHEEATTPPEFDINYGTVRFLAGQIDGREVAGWLEQRSRDVTLPENRLPAKSETKSWSRNQNTSEESVHFSALPVPAMNWRRFSNHALVDYHAVHWPMLRFDYSPPGAANDPPPGFLLADHAPFFSSFKTALLQLIYWADDSEVISRNFTLTPSIILRLAESRAWLRNITLSPTAITVEVAGDAVPGVQLTITGGRDIFYQEVLAEPTSILRPLPNRIPVPLYVVLSQGNQWLDFYHYEPDWPITERPQDNVTFEYGDSAGKLEALIQQGEGITIEFKDKIPENQDQMLKTVAAFANGEGGVILLGVRDGTGELTGIEQDISELRDRLTNLIRSRVFPEPSFHFKSAEISHSKVLAIYIDSGARPPYGINQPITSYFIRRGATTFPARPEELHRIIAAQSTINSTHYYR